MEWINKERLFSIVFRPSCKSYSLHLFFFFEFSSESKVTTKTNFLESGVIHLNEWQSLEKCDRFLFVRDDIYPLNKFW
jgi:hypothetical protein